MDVHEFLDRVEGALLWHEYQLDAQLNNHAWYTANLMIISGNMKKGTDAFTVKKNLYRSLEDLEEAKKTPEVKDAKAEKEKLLQRFKIDESIIK